MQISINYHKYRRFDSLSTKVRNTAMRLPTRGIAAVGGVSEGVDVEAVEARGEAREPSPHLGVP
jgi:hypothetical protein